MSAICSARGSDTGERGFSSLARRRKIVDENLPRFLAPEAVEIPPRLREAMEYSLGAGGKRLRPVLLLSAGAAVGGDEEALLPFACAVEYVHTYSLIHDDLPAMDDDDFRRGRPSCHKAFGEALAILAGDGLLTEAFRVMAESPLAAREPGRVLRAIGILGRAAGAEGMVGGQQMDICPDLPGEPAEAVTAIEARKTAALFAAAARMGAVLGGGTDEQEARLASFGRALGHLFQATDDILDETGKFEEMGKGVDKDRKRGKMTYPIVLGVDAARTRAGELAREALAAVAGFGGEADPLREIVGLVLGRRS